MASKMSDAFKSEFAAGLARKSLPPNEHFMLMCEMLRKHKMCYKLLAHPRLFMTHYKNRGGLLLSPHNAHKNAAQIKRAGADLELLTNSWCTELPDSGKLRETHIQKNSALIQRSEGLLAQLTGEERFCSLGAGHTVAFCKHAVAGGETTLESLQMTNSRRIDVQALSTNQSFKQMLEVGWEWNVVYACVDQEFEAFAQLAQRALNTRNHTSNVIGELEVCMTLADTMEDTGFIETVSDWKSLALENINSLCPPCAGYASYLLEYIDRFGGGSGAPIIVFMDNVAKQFQANVALGETFWRALAKTEFADMQCQYPLVRAALMLTNLTTNKVEDSIARLINKSHVASVASKQNMAAATEAEHVLGEAFELAKTISSVEKLVKPLGQLFVRVGVKLCDMEKKSLEGKTFSIQQLKSMFLKSASDVVGATVEFSSWFEGEKTPDAADHQPARAATGPKMAKLEDHSDPVWICNSRGFKIGSIVIEKSVQGSSMYTIFEIADKHAVLYEALSYTGEPVKVNIGIDELLSNWTISKSDPPLRMQDPSVELPPKFKIEMQRCQILEALNTLWEKHMNGYKCLSYFKNPDQLRTNVSIKSGKLTMVPAVPLVNIVMQQKATQQKMIPVGKIQGHNYWIVPMSKPAVKADEWGDSFVNPFFWVKETPNRKEANMVAGSISLASGVTIPTLTNNEELEPFTKLQVFVKPAPKVAPLKNASILSDEGDDDDAEATANAAAKATAKAAAKGKAKAKSECEKRKAVQSSSKAVKKGKS
jgi:hypothetical protein